MSANEMIESMIVSYGSTPDKLHELATICLAAADEAFPARSNSISVAPGDTVFYLSAGPALFRVRHSRSALHSAGNFIEIEYEGERMLGFTQSPRWRARKELKPARTPGQLRYHVKRFILGEAKNKGEHQQYSEVETILWTDIEHLVRKALFWKQLHAVARRQGFELKGNTGTFTMTGDGIEISGRRCTSGNHLIVEICGGAELLHEVGTIAELGLQTHTEKPANGNDNGNARSDTRTTGRSTGRSA